MSWRRGTCKGKDVWIEVDASGSPVVQGGRVPVRYSPKAGAKIYRAGKGNVAVTGDVDEDLPDGAAQEPGAARGGRKGKGSGFGSAGKRTASQAAAAKQAAGELLASFADDAIVCFTDGACKGNPGPAGSGVVVRLADGRRLEAHKALGQGTNNIGELTAIGVAMDLLDEAGVPPEAEVHVLTDSDYSQGVLVRGWKAKANQALIARVKGKLAQRNVTLHWIAGHAGIADNERADALANMGVDESCRMR